MKKPLSLAITMLITLAGFSQTATWNTNLNTGSSSTPLKLGTNNATDLIFYTDNAEGMRLTKDGKLNIHGLSNLGSPGSLLIIDQHGNIGASNGYSESGESSPYSPCTQYAPWYVGGNNFPLNPEIGSCTYSDFILKSNNVKTVFIKPSGKVGIGTNNPSSKLTVSDAADVEALVISTGSSKAILGVANTQSNYHFNIDNVGIGHIGSGIGSLINFKLHPQFGGPQVWIGKRPTIAPHDDFHLAVDGKLVAKSIYVTLTGAWADYVFDKEYALPLLEDVEKYYKENKHLPEVPSAIEIEEKGIDVSQMNTLLLKKIEELTIYVVEQKKEITMLKENYLKKTK